MSTVDFVSEGVSIHDMRILLVGAGGVGSAIAAIAARRGFAEVVVAEYDLARAQRVAGERSAVIQLDARDSGAVAAAIKAHDCGEPRRGRL
jgi:saccharopine dehydrogenase-like NADP-dependent oxidoreductase